MSAEAGAGRAYAAQHAAAALLQEQLPPGALVWYGEKSGRYYLMVGFLLIDRPDLGELAEVAKVVAR